MNPLIEGMHSTFMPIDLKKMSTEEIIELYPKIIKELKSRDVMQTKNFIGEIGEFLAIHHYNKNPEFPNLKRADVSTKNLDAISRDGERYSIKSTSTATTGTFWGMNPPDSGKKDLQKFEYVVIVVFDGDYDLSSILEISWEQFLKIKRWHSRMNAWNIPINAALLKMAKKVT